MYPVIQLGGLSISTYGLMAAIAVAVGISLSAYLAKVRGYVVKDHISAGMYAVLGGLAGAALLYQLVAIPHYLAGGGFMLGFVFYGGFIGGVITVIVYTKIFKVNLWRLAECVAPALPLSHAIGRVGCYFAGCCYGIPSEHGMVFASLVAHGDSTRYIPIQLMEVALNVGLCVALLRIFFSRKVLGGKLFLLYTICYGIVRFVLEFFRGDLQRGLLGHLSTSQYISIFVLAVALNLWWSRIGFSRRPGDFDDPK